MLIVRPALPDDVRVMLSHGEKLPVQRARYGALLAQVTLGEAWAAVRHAEPSGVPLAIAGIAPLGSTAGEFWFSVRPGALSDPSLLRGVVQHARWRLAERLADYPDGLIALIAPGHRPGERLARLVGCVPTGYAFLGQAEWRFTGERHHKSFRRGIEQRAA